MASLPTRGIDISEFNGDVNIDALKGQIDFVIIRCGYGSNYTNQDDTQYENNVRKCLAAGDSLWGSISIPMPKKYGYGEKRSRPYAAAASGKNAFVRRVV